MANDPKEVVDQIRKMETDHTFDKFTLSEIYAIARAEYKLKNGIKLSNYQRFIHLSSLYYFNYHVPEGIPDHIKVAAKRFTRSWK
jgi:hypothetical protein